MKTLPFSSLFVLLILLFSFHAHAQTFIGDYQVFWTDVHEDLAYNTEENLLTFDRTNTYGNAFSLNKLEADYEEHITFTVPQNSKITIGLVHTTGTYNHSTYALNYNEIEYGFHFENDEAVIVNEGNILPDFGPQPYAYDEPFEIIFRYGNIAFYYNDVEVYNVDYEVTASLKLEVLFTAEDATFLAPNTNLKCPLSVSYTTTEQDHNGGGSIQTAAIGGKRPYRYIWNDAPFIDKENYDRFVSSYYTELRKTENAHIASQFNLSRVLTYDEFVAYKASSQVSNLMSRLYKLKLIDSENDELQVDIPVSAATTWPSSTDYSFSTGELTKATNHTNIAATPAITSDNILYPKKDGRFGFRIGTVGEKVIGIRDGNLSPTDYRNTQFGFYIYDTDVYLFKDGAIEGEVVQEDITSSDKIEIVREGNTFSARINGLEVGTYADAYPEELKRLDVYMSDIGQIFRPDEVYCWWYVPIVSIREEEGICGLKSTTLVAENEAMIHNRYPYPVTFDWTDHRGFSNYPNSSTLSNVDPGWYGLIASVAHPTAPYAFPVGTYYIGYKVNWIQEVNLVNQPTTNSLELNPFATYPNANAFGESNSSNVFNQPVDNNYGWIYTEVPGLATGKSIAMELDPYGENQRFYPVNGFIDGSIPDGGFNAGFSVTRYGFKSMPIGNAPMEYGISIAAAMMYFNSSVTGDFLLSLHPPMISGSYGGFTHFQVKTGDKIVQLIDGNDYKLYINGVLEATVNISGLSAINYLNVKGEVSASIGNLIIINPNGTTNYGHHDQVLNCLASFKCRDQSYNLLAPELRAEHYNTINGNLYFQFQGEYNYGPLDYVVKDLKGNDVTINTNISTGDKDYGDNRYILNMNKLSDGYYTLTVTNEKRENYFLRIYKEY